MLAGVSAQVPSTPLTPGPALVGAAARPWAFRSRRAVPSGNMVGNSDTSGGLRGVANENAGAVFPKGVAYKPEAHHFLTAKHRDIDWWVEARPWC